jgi:hypothetical protein
VATAEVRHGAAVVVSPPLLRRDTRTLLSGFLIAGFPATVFEQPTEPLETALSNATASFLRTFGRLVLHASAQQQEQEGQPLLLPLELTAELLPQMAAYEAAHAAWTAAYVPRLVRRLHLSLLALAQARATALGSGDHVLVAHMDTSISQLRANLARLAGGPEALAAINAAGVDGVDDLLMLPHLNLNPHNNNDADAEEEEEDA